MQPRISMVSHSARGIYKKSKYIKRIITAEDGLNEQCVYECSQKLAWVRLSGHEATQKYS